MTSFRVRFDGRVLIPERPLDLPVGQVLEVSARPVRDEEEKNADAPLMRLASLADQFPENPDLPTDGAAEHDHYLYGTPKRP